MNNENENNKEIIFNKNGKNIFKNIENKFDKDFLEKNNESFVYNYINNIGKVGSNDICKNKNNKNFLSSSSGGIGIRIKEKYEIDDKEFNNNKINNLQNEQNTYDMMNWEFI